MAEFLNWLLVREDVLPDVYRRVLAAKEDLSSGRIQSVSAATRFHGISRSAYYKYKDAVARYVAGTAPTTMAVELLLQDCPGVLSGVLAAFSQAGVNIITVNQDSPSGGTARVTICANTENIPLPMNLFLEQIRHISGVQRINSIHQKPITYNGN